MKKAPTFFAVMLFLLVLAVSQWLLPARKMSELENRMLSAELDVSLAGILRGSWAEDMETFVSDQLPGRDTFVSLYFGVKTLCGHRVLNGIVLGNQGWMFDEGTDWSERNVRLNTQALAELALAVDVPVFLLAPPSSGLLYRQSMPGGLPRIEEEALLQIANENIPLIDLLPAMRQASQQNLYYHTDHHWTLAGAKIGYQAVCEALGISPLPDVPEKDVPGFYGSYYSRCPVPWASPDTFSYAVPEHISLSIGHQPKDGIVNLEELEARDKYAALLYGNHAYIELVNAEISEGTLIVIKDSFANALLPLLARHYHKIIAVDPRYYTENIVNLIQHEKGDSVLCVYGIHSLALSRTLALLEGF